MLRFIKCCECQDHSLRGKGKVVVVVVVVDGLEGIDDDDEGDMNSYTIVYSLISLSPFGVCEIIDLPIFPCNCRKSSNDSKFQEGVGTRRETDLLLPLNPYQRTDNVFFECVSIIEGIHPFPGHNFRFVPDSHL